MMRYKYAYAQPPPPPPWEWEWGVGPLTAHTASINQASTTMPPTRPPPPPPPPSYPTQMQMPPPTKTKMRPRFLPPLVIPRGRSLEKVQPYQKPAHVQQQQQQQQPQQQQPIQIHKPIPTRPYGPPPRPRMAAPSIDLPAFSPLEDPELFLFSNPPSEGQSSRVEQVQVVAAVEVKPAPASVSVAISVLPPQVLSPVPVEEIVVSPVTALQVPQTLSRHQHPDSAIMILGSAEAKLSESPVPMSTMSNKPQLLLTTSPAPMTSPVVPSPEKDGCPPIPLPRTLESTPSSRLRRRSAIYRRSGWAGGATSPRKMKRMSHQQAIQRADTWSSLISSDSDQGSPVEAAWNGKRDGGGEEGSPKEVVLDAFDEMEQDALRDLLDYIDTVLGSPEPERKFSVRRQGSGWWGQVRRSLL